MRLVGLCNVPELPLGDSLISLFWACLRWWLLLEAATDQKALWGRSLRGLKQEAKLLRDTRAQTPPGKAGCRGWSGMTLRSLSNETSG